MHACRKRAASMLSMLLLLHEPQLHAAVEHNFQTQPAALCCVPRPTVVFSSLSPTFTTTYERCLVTP